MKPFKNIPGQHIGSISRGYTKRKPTRFYLSGITDFDNFSGGFPTGEMTLIAARPGVGKTSLALQIVENIGATEGVATGVFSIEMTGPQLVTRMIMARTNLPSVPLRKGELNAKQVILRDKALAEIGELPIYIDDSSYATIAHVEKVARAWIKAGIRVLVLDYVQLMSVGKSSGDNRANFVGECAKALKRIARDNDIPFIVLAQLNREAARGKRAPTGADLRDSGELEQVADNILILHPDAEDPSVIDMILEKWRNGSRGIVSVIFDAPRTRFKNMEKD